MQSAERVGHLVDEEFLAVHVRIARAGPEVCVVGECVACRQGRAGQGMGVWQMRGCVRWN